MPSEAAAAVAEVDGGSITAQWRGLTLTLPSVLPPTMFFDVVEGEDGNVLAMFRLLRDLLGSDQFGEVRKTITPADDAGDVITDLFEVIFADYGADLGEASASPTSS